MEWSGDIRTMTSAAGNHPTVTVLLRDDALLAAMQRLKSWVLSLSGVD